MLFCFLLYSFRTVLGFERGQKPFKHNTDNDIDRYDGTDKYKGDEIDRRRPIQVRYDP